MQNKWNDALIVWKKGLSDRMHACFLYDGKRAMFSHYDGRFYLISEDGESRRLHLNLSEQFTPCDSNWQPLPDLAFKYGSRPTHLPSEGPVEVIPTVTVSETL
jgi:hypothetical protein